MYYNKVHHKNYHHKSYTRSPSAILPSPSILRGYDEISEGAADRLLEMAEIEQAHRHEWEFAALHAYERSFRLGQKCGALVAIVITLATIYASAALHNNYLAAIISISGFAAIMVSTFFAAKNKRYETRVRREPVEKDL
jgi:uncharacterized membrane protein